MLYCTERQLTSVDHDAVVVGDAGTAASTPEISKLYPFLRAHFRRSGGTRWWWAQTMVERADSSPNCLGGCHASNLDGFG